MKYSIDQVHKEKNGFRGEGRTVDAVMELIGRIMVTENERIPVVLPEAIWMSNFKKVFIDVCIEHFKEEPIFEKATTLGIKGYTSNGFMVLQSDRQALRGISQEPIFDTY